MFGNGGSYTERCSVSPRKKSACYHSKGNYDESDSKCRWRTRSGSR
jgi:hypothetical protein